MHRRPLLLLTRLRWAQGAARAAATDAAAPPSSRRSRLRENQEALQSRRTSAVQLVQGQLDQLQGQQERVKSFLSVADSQRVSTTSRVLHVACWECHSAVLQVLEAAEQLDKQLSNGTTQLGPLAGSLIGVKVGHSPAGRCWLCCTCRVADRPPLQDSLCTKDMHTTAGSGVLREYQPPYDATAVQHLRAAGMTLAGKCNLDAFAMGSTTELSDFWVSLGLPELSPLPFTLIVCSLVSVLCSPHTTLGACSTCQADPPAALQPLWQQASAWALWAATQVCSQASVTAQAAAQKHTAACRKRIAVAAWPCSQRCSFKHARALPQSCCRMGDLRCVQGAASGSQPASAAWWG